MIDIRNAVVHVKIFSLQHFTWSTYYILYYPRFLNLYLRTTMQFFTWRTRTKYRNFRHFNLTPSHDAKSIAMWVNSQFVHRIIFDIWLKYPWLPSYVHSADISIIPRYISFFLLETSFSSHSVFSPSTADMRPRKENENARRRACQGFVSGIDEGDEGGSRKSARQGRVGKARIISGVVAVNFSFFSPLFWAASQRRVVRNARE